MNVGKELDAAVLRAMGKIVVETSMTNEPIGVGPIWYENGNSGPWNCLTGIISTSDPEAFRLCGPWLDERCEWHLSFHREEECGERKHVAAAYDKDLYFFKVRCATRAEAIARLVIAVAAREAEQKEPTT